MRAITWSQNARHCVECGRVIDPLELCIQVRHGIVCCAQCDEWYCEARIQYPGSPPPETGDLARFWAARGRDIRESPDDDIPF